MKENLLGLMYGLPVLLPMFLAGLLVRFAGRGKSGGWRITALSVAVTVVAWLIALPLSRHGSELPGIAAGFITGFPVGSAVCGIGLRLRRAVR